MKFNTIIQIFKNVIFKVAKRFNEDKNINSILSVQYTVDNIIKSSKKNKAK